MMTLDQKLAQAAEDAQAIVREIDVPQLGRPRTNWVMAVAAAVVVLLVGGLTFWLGARGDDTTPVTQPLVTTAVPPTTSPTTTGPDPTTPSEVLDGYLEIAKSFFEARAAWDAEATMALFAPDAVVDDVEVRSVADYADRYRWYQAVDWRWTVRDCFETPAISAEVRCTFTHHNAWTDAMELEPVGGNYEFDMANGQITGLTMYSSLEVGGPVWDAFRNWVGDNHPEDALTMYNLGTESEICCDAPYFPPAYTPESLTLWEQYSDEFVTSAPALP